MGEYGGKSTRTKERWKKSKDKNFFLINWSFSFHLISFSFPFIHSFPFILFFEDLWQSRSCKGDLRMGKWGKGEEAEEGEEGEGLGVEEGEEMAAMSCFAAFIIGELALVMLPHKDHLTSAMLPSSRWLTMVVLHGSGVLHDGGWRWWLWRRHGEVLMAIRFQKRQIEKRSLVSWKIKK